MSGMGGFEFKGCGGGVVVFWDNRVLQLEEMEVGNYSISCRFKNVEDGFCWVFFRSLRTLCEGGERGVSERIGAIKGLWNDPWGDDERAHTFQIREHVAEGGRLQRGAEEMVGEIQISGTASYILSEKLKALKPTLKKWNTEVFGQIKVKKQEAWNSLDFWDKEERVQELSLEEEEARKEAREMYKKWGDQRGGVQGVPGAAGRPGGVEAQDRRLTFERLEEGDVEGLEKPFTEEEVFRALSSCCGEKRQVLMVFQWLFGNFRGISLRRGHELFRQFHETGSFTLANRMKGVLAKVISTAQNAFVEGRQIMDAVLVANEAIDSIVKSNRGAILCKLDIEKAYDHVDWDFLLAVMEKMGFGERWCRWIKWCLSTVRAISGLRVNLEKSELIPVGRVENVDELADEFGYRVGKLPSTYLGMPLGAPFKSVAAWDGIEERFRKKLAMWKRQYISKGERITLVRSTLANLPIYFMSIFQMPGVVRIRLEKIQRDFLWGGGALVQKPHLVKWSIVCLDKRSGGLGLRILGPSIGLSFGKWVWRFANERNALWNQVIRGKYGEERGGWRSCEPREAYGLGLWKAISKMGHKVTPFVGFVVGDGEKVKFWKDKWCETIPLSEVFPSLFALASNKEAWVKEVWTAGGKGGSWNPCFNRPFNDWEMEEVERLLCCLEGRSRVSCFFPFKNYMELLCAAQIELFCVGGFLGRVLTLDRLQKRGWVMANRCFLCHKSEETIDHLLIHCEKTREVWMVFLSFFGVSWVFPPFGQGNPCRVEGVLCGKEKEGGVAIGTVMLVLGYLEG
ncbi:putative ribonuclease H protein [Vitis vinifera]|uniref:Putative ribonuclease H protein n=1 Tax=Vitis vinifera TaxID=29760 RepID=A0A438KGK2_VITVI|nr:putative ribonuclease H protein [Vitis vinifera]